LFIFDRTPDPDSFCGKFLFIAGVRKLKIKKPAIVIGNPIRTGWNLLLLRNGL
jgi:hypothetical protein